ncbi:E2F transcription factor 3 [Parelaphostrongylus tenuis]|uniref:E2F transcription factor 3 n=1 Tax=Parelaphostrongylus tenuis TaxID=148309 RepID=A0AAD5MWQ7_PARTN|nr:E2F transcription factor 3 [Parelaphostrongylus tenuis]
MAIPRNALKPRTEPNKLWAGTASIDLTHISQQAGMTHYRQQPYLPYHVETSSAVHHELYNASSCSDVRIVPDGDVAVKPKEKIETPQSLEEENKLYSSSPTINEVKRFSNTTKVRRKLNLKESEDAIILRALVSRQESITDHISSALKTSTIQSTEKRKNKANCSNTELTGVHKFGTPTEITVLIGQTALVGEVNSVRDYETPSKITLLHGQAVSLNELKGVRKFESLVDTSSLKSHRVFHAKMAGVCKLQSPADISLMDGQPAVLIKIIEDLRPDVIKVKQEVMQYIEPATAQKPPNDRLLKSVTENAHGHAQNRLSINSGVHGNNLSHSARRPQDNSSRPAVKEVRLGKKKHSDLRPKDKHVTTRMDNSLLVATKKFIQLNKEDNIINLNEAALLLNVPKRRLYDITNVLEGVDLVEKVGKNSIRWKTDDGDIEELRTLWSQCKSLVNEEKELDEVITDLTSAVKIMKEDPTDMPQGYVRLEELRNLTTFRDQTLVILKSHPDTRCLIEINPSSSHQHQLKMKTDDNSPLRAYICESGNHTLSSIEELLLLGVLSFTLIFSTDEADI